MLIHRVTTVELAIELAVPIGERLSMSCIPLDVRKKSSTLVPIWRTGKHSPRLGYDGDSPTSGLKDRLHLRFRIPETRRAVLNDLGF